VRRQALGFLVAACAVLVLAGCGGDSDEPAEATETTSGVAECRDVEAPAPREPGGAAAPTDALDADKDWTLTFATSCGSFVVTLDLDAAPETSASLVALAEDGFYDDTIFHRIVPGFVIQGGDPTQSGGGGPGYSTVDAPPADAAYVNENTDCVGFVGASSLERLGVEGPLVELTRKFKQIPAPAAKKR